ncbi:hypothetical protein O0235_07200 [Tepidiforma flava]|uniref:Uncharacterized protein n=1 Tax=Tepidiforma flava TaxID=3004094 RepID=A0ABY7MAP6_9CHLR|nr:hypothetical protein [Tepidiforma flava]WBL37352.1 hypothetical protein O0235_07200 [Tepidiforma flava]
MDDSSEPGSPGGEVAIVCAWCRQQLSGAPSGRVSHGICPRCAREFLERLPASYLESIADDDGTVTLFSGYRFALEEVRRAAG